MALDCQEQFELELEPMSEPVPIAEQLPAFAHDFEALCHEVGKRIVGQSQAICGVVTAAVCGGHVLIEGPPGVGKTALVEAFARAADLALQRIQFTPELMPADLLGTHVIIETAQGRRTFEFQQGPIFANVVLADHINRGLPRTQSALLQAMEGGEISVAHETFQLPAPFLVMATQNPQESEGTYPLPEPEIDRFFFKLVFARPSVAELEAIVEQSAASEPPPFRAVVDGRRLLKMRQLARQVEMPPALRRWAVMLAAATHPDDAHAPQSVRRFVREGASPRGAQALVLGAKATAAAAGRAVVEAEDVRAVAPWALAHRITLNFEGHSEQVPAGQLVTEILEALAPPA